MVDYRFEEEKSLAQGQIEVAVKSYELDSQAQQVLDYLARFQQEGASVLPVKTSDRVEMVRIDDLILVDVEGPLLLIDTVKGRLVTNERLYKFIERLGNPDFIQVSKHALININHLQALENSFSGNMLAILTGRLKTDVSRRYLTNLEKRLGL